MNMVLKMSEDELTIPIAGTSQIHTTTHSNTIKTKYRILHLLRKKLIPAYSEQRKNMNTPFSAEK